MQSVFLNRVSTAVPPNEVHAAFVDAAPALIEDPRALRLFRRMADRSRIERRWSVLAAAGPDAGDRLDRDGFYRRGAFPGTAERMAAYERHAAPLACRAVEGLGLDAAELRRVTHVVVTTCTGFYAPGLDFDVVDRFGLDPSVERTAIGFMGCYAGITGLKTARHVVRSDPRARVLVVNLELCTLHLQEGAGLETMLSFALFGDGAAAALVSADPDGIELVSFRAATLPSTPGLITWRIGAQGFDMHLSGEVPHALASGLAGGLPEIAEDAARGGPALWAVHPGGRTVLDAVAHAFRLPPDALADSREVLRGFGNMSSATVMFVLARMLGRVRATGEGAGLPGWAMAFGPGLAAETMRFRMPGG
jgi:predicted naringenin-chalcone synthase